jgi:putative N6-adenine-specific DNA methylase
VDEDIQFHEVRFEMSKIDNVPSYLITNPPYDERLMSLREIDALYQAIGRTFKRLSKVDRYVLSSVSGTEQKLGLAPHQTRVLFNGPIKARYYQFFHES